MSDPQNSSSKEKADVFLQLGKTAQERFDTHHSVEWKVHFGIWTFYILGTLALVNVDKDGKYLFLAKQDSLTPIFIFIFLVALGIYYIYAWWWLPHSHEYREECTRSRWWFEMCAIDAIYPEGIDDREKRLPKIFKKIPKYPKTRPPGWSVPWQTKQQWARIRPFDIHKSQSMALVVTIVMLGLFFSGLWIRYQEVNDYSCHSCWLVAYVVFCLVMIMLPLQPLFHLCGKLTKWKCHLQKWKCH